VASVEEVTEWSSLLALALAALSSLLPAELESATQVIGVWPSELRAIILTSGGA
jgi:hypothetical protein